MSESPDLVETTDERTGWERGLALLTAVIFTGGFSTGEPELIERYFQALTLLA